MENMDIVDLKQQQEIVNLMTIDVKHDKQFARVEIQFALLFVWLAALTIVFGAMLVSKKSIEMRFGPIQMMEVPKNATSH